MTYQQLLERLQAMSDEQRANDVTVLAWRGGEVVGLLDFIDRPWDQYRDDTSGITRWLAGHVLI